MITKEDRLKLLKEIGQRQAERESLMFSGLAVTKQEINDDIKFIDAFREDRKDKCSGRHAINSDEI